MQTSDGVAGDGSVLSEEGVEGFFRGGEGEVAYPDAVRGALGGSGGGVGGGGGGGGVIRAGWYRRSGDGGGVGGGGGRAWESGCLLLLLPFQSFRSLRSWFRRFDIDLKLLVFGDIDTAAFT